MAGLGYRFLFPALWLGLAIYWWWSSRRVKAALRRESFGSRLAHVLPLLAASALLGPEKLPGRLLNERFLSWTPWQYWASALVTAVGLGFAVWARRHIGRNWSGIVTLKQGHELVTSGPYAIVRHPIYTGLLVAIAGTGWARGEWRAVLALLIAGLALWRKLRLEERWMIETFGERYAAYRHRVPALVPFPRRRRRALSADA